MHGRFARYGFTGDAHELARQAEDGMLPIFEAQPGFQAYSLVESDDEILSFSAWDSKESAEAATMAAADWVAANLGDRLELKESRIGEILLGTKLGVSAKAGVAA
ncbi:MAG TPA: antibiotic biosynthesis monooxygenase [Gaiella sp.]